MMQPSPDRGGRIVRKLERDGVALAFEEAGSGQPPILLVHGWSCDHTSFAPQFEHFGRSHRVLAVDLRGHGGSDAPRQEYTIRTPALYIQAAAPRPELAQFRELCPQLVVGQTVGAGHFNQLEVPDQVNAMIERFLTISLPSRNASQ
jgi:pimeloyl-ACP methyl ester carboxylesterase